MEFKNTKNSTTLFRHPLINLGVFFILGLIAVVISGGVWLSRGDWVYPSQPKALQVLTYQSGDVAFVGQSFVAEQSGLQAIDVKFAEVSASESITLHLLERGSNADEIRQVTLEPEKLSQDGWARFSFVPITESRLQSYYLFFDSPLQAETDEGNFGLYYGPPDSYFDGVLYVNDQPQDGQLTFNLVYSRRDMLIEVVKGVVSAIPEGGLVLLVYLVPGWAILALARKLSGQTLIHHWVEGLVVAFVLSAALYPLLMLWTDTIGLHLGSFYPVVAVLAGGGVLIWLYRPWTIRRINWSERISRWVTSNTFWADVAFLAIIAIVFIGRMLIARSMLMPMWDDSIQHTVIVSRMLENGGLFRLWEPYTPYQTFSFHFGFYADIAVFAWSTGLDAVSAVIWGGQFVNLLAVLALYPLAYRISGVWGGVIAVLVAGLFTQFPGYYVNWGRYPQLSGQVILPVACWWLWMMFCGYRHKQSWLKAMLWLFIGACFIAGAILSYYRMAFHFIAFVMAVLLVFDATSKVWLTWQRWRNLLTAAVWAGVLMSPVLSQQVGRLTGAETSGNANAVSVSIWNKVQALSVNWSALLVLVIFLGILLIVWQGKKYALPVIWFGALVVVLPLLRLMPLPGVGIIQQFTIDTSLYIPVALIWGSVAGFLMLKAGTRQWVNIAAAGVLILLAVIRLPEQPLVLDRKFDLSSRPDLTAADWVNENLPPDAVFLINGIIYTDGRSSVGGDGGWWLPTLTKRRVTIPPQYALLAEEPITAGYSQQVNDLTHHLFDVLPNTAQGKAAICAFPESITHVYLGQGRGMVDEAIFAPPRPMLPADLLAKDPDFHLIYQYDRVMIFEFNRRICNEL